MLVQRCGLCGRSAPADELTTFRGLKGWVCRPGLGCDRDHPALAAIRQWLAGPDAHLTDEQLNDIYVDNPPSTYRPPG